MRVEAGVQEKMLCRIMIVDEMQFGFMPKRGTIDVVFILRRMHERYCAKGKKFYMCFVHLEKAFDRVPTKVLECSMMKKGIPEVSVMRLYEGVETRVRLDSELSEESDVKVGLHQGSVLSPFSAVVVDVVTKLARSELLYAVDLVLICVTIKGFRNKFLKWKEAFENKG